MQPGTSETLQHWRWKSAVPDSHTPSLIETRERASHPVTPCIPGFAEKGQARRDSGDRDLSLVFRRRGQGTIRSSSCKTKKARCDVLLQEQNEGAQRRGEQRREEQRRAERKSGCTGIQGYSLLSAALLWQLCRPSLRAPACLPASLPLCSAFGALTTSQRASQEQKLPVNASRSSVLPEHSTLSSNLSLNLGSRCS
jgi:hypothetical protein